MNIIKEKINELINKYDLEWIFFIFICGAVVGFVHEELYYWIFFDAPGYYGALWGPYIPIYGIGAIAIYYLSKVIKNAVVMFVTIFVGSGILEHFTGVLILKLFNRRFWDYRNLPFNFDKEGFVCLRGALAFSGAGLVFVYFLEPLLRKWYGSFDPAKRSTVLRILFLIVMFDFFFSFFIYGNPSGQF